MTLLMQRAPLFSSRKTLYTKLWYSVPRRWQQLSATVQHDEVEPGAVLLGSQLSKPNFTSTEKRKWEKMCRSFPSNQKKLSVPDEYYDYIRSMPPYENRALEQVHKLSFDSNVLLEIRDVRLPASTHHPSFTRLAKHRHHLICYTHADMIDPASREAVEKWTQRSWPKSYPFFCDTREHHKAEVFGSLYNWLVSIMDSVSGFNCALTTGVANTGKSSVLSALLKYAKKEKHLTTVRSNEVSPKGKRVRSGMRKSGRPQIEDVPGKTRTLTEWVLRDSPRLFFLDVPGVTQPYFFFLERPEAWYGMGAANLIHQTASMRSDAYLQRAFCEYVLSCLNRDGCFNYVKKLDLSQPTDDIDECLNFFEKKFEDRMDEEQLLLKRTQKFLKFFNTGNFGSCILDDLSRPYQPFRFKHSHFEHGRNKHDDDYDDDEDEDDDDNVDDWYKKTF